jgi:hypothetical protein
MRVVLGFVVTAAALGAAIWLSGARLEAASCRDAERPVPCSSVAAGWTGYAPLDGSVDASGSIQTVLPRVVHPQRKAAWQDPIVALLVVAGIGGGIALILTGGRPPEPAG